MILRLRLGFVLSISVRTCDGGNAHEAKQLEPVRIAPEASQDRGRCRSRRRCRVAWRRRAARSSADRPRHREPWRGRRPEISGVCQNQDIRRGASGTDAASARPDAGPGAHRSRAVLLFRYRPRAGNEPGCSRRRRVCPGDRPRPRRHRHRRSRRIDGQARPGGRPCHRGEHRAVRRMLQLPAGTRRSLPLERSAASFPSPRCGTARRSSSGTTRAATPS